MRRSRLSVVAAAAIAAAVSFAIAGGGMAEARAPQFKPQIVRILSPRVDDVVTGSLLRVTIALPRGTRQMRVFVGVRNVSARFRRSGVTATAVIPSALLRHGINTITVRVTTATAIGETHTAVLFGRRQGSLVSLTVRGGSSLSIRLGGPVAGTVLHATLNGRNVGSEFSARGPNLRSATLSAAHGVRRGTNVVRVLLARRSDGAWAQVTRTIRIGSGVVLASIRPTRGGLIGRALRLDAAPSQPVGGRGRLSYRWVLVSKPHGSHARLLGAGSIRPRLVPDRAGDYVVRLRVEQVLPAARIRGRVMRTGAAARSRVVASTITRDYEVAPQFGPFGEQIETLAAASGGGYAVQIGAPGQPGAATVPITIGNRGYEIVFINRATGAVDGSSSVLYGDEPALVKVLSGALATPYELAVVAAQPTGRGTMNVSSADQQALSSAMGMIGASVPSSFIGTGGFSVIGIPQGPNSQAAPNSAWENLGGDQASYGDPAQKTGDMIGRLIPDSNSSFSSSGADTVIQLTFMFTGYVPFNTGTNGTAQGISVGTPTPVFAALPANPGPGGFQVAVLDEHTLGPTATGTFCTVSGCPDPSGAESAMLAQLDDYNNGQEIVIVQSFGAAVSGSDEGWGALADQIRNMGGNPDLFNTFHGSYAFIATPGHAPAELSGNSATDTTAGFNGLFGRDSQDRWYIAQTGLGTSSPNLQLPIIASANPTPFPYQGQSWLPATEQYIEKNLNNLGSQNTYCPYNDCLRALYWTDNEGIDWATASSSVKTVPEPAPSVFDCNPHTTNCAARWTSIVTEFSNEFNYVTEITSLFTAIENTIPASLSLAGYDLTSLTDDIENYIGQAQAKADSKNSKLTEGLGITSGILSALSSLGSIAGVESAGVGAAISVPLGVLAGGATIAGAAATSSTDGYPALQGDAFASAATIGQNVADQFQALYSSLGTIEDIILGDGGKELTVGQDINESVPGWTYSAGSNTSATLQAVRLSLRRYIYQNLYRQYVFPVGATHPKYPAYCAELGAADLQKILGSTTRYGGPGTGYAALAHSGDAWYTFLITYAQQGGNSPLGTASINPSGDNSLAYPAGSSLFDTTGNNSTAIPASQFAYSGQPTNVGSPSQLFLTPVADPYVPPTGTNPPDQGGLGFNVSEFFWNVFQPYGTYTAPETGYVGVC